MLISKMHILCVLMLIIVPVSVHAKAAGCVEGNCDTGSGVYHYEGQLFGQQYDGQWLAGGRTGADTHNDTGGHWYEGDWLAGKRQGHGIYYYAEGERYDGKFKDNRKQGQGTYYFSDGGRYDGAWADNQPNGRGVIRYSDGGCYAGDISWGTSRVKASCTASRARS